MDPRGRKNAGGRPPRLLAVNQVVGPLMRELLEDLTSAGVDCQVLAGQVELPAGRAPAFGVLAACPLAKAPAGRRGWSWLRFTVQAAGAMWRRRRGQALITTNPPWVMLLAPWLKRWAGLRYVLLIYDVYPDVAERMGLLAAGGAIARLWRALSRNALLRADGVITLGEHMAESLRRHLRAGEELPIEVIPNWADTEFIRPRPKADNPFALRHGLAEEFVVMYSGAFGATHDAESIFLAAERLTDLPDVRFVLIGGGTRQRQVRQLAAAKGLPNLTLLPLQPPEALPESLPAADCAIVSLDVGYEGVSVPSKTYAMLAAGAALLAVTAEGTELADLVAECRCGLVVPPRSPDALAEAVRRLYRDRALLGRCRSAARSAAEGRFSRRQASCRYLQYLRRRLGWAPP